MTMIAVDIPGFGELRLAHLVCDYTGTLTGEGRLVPGVRELLTRLADRMEIHVVTADTLGTAAAELAGLPCRVHFLTPGREAEQKEAYVDALGANSVVALGNGNNDAAMLKIARIGIAICLGEGCAVKAAAAADILLTSITAALGLLLRPQALKATLRH
jgi:P-type E1-E2 ATPase